MSSNYALYEIDKISKRFAPASGVPRGVKPRYNINPSQPVVAIVCRNGVNVIEQMKWGFISAGAQDANSIFRYKTYIAKSEAVFNKPTWSRAIREQRCLIPANGFYDWKNLNSGKVPYYIQIANQSLFAFAGIYSTWVSPDGVQYGTCAIITTSSDTNNDMIPSRLPVIVEPIDEADWLNPNISDMNSLYRIMKPFGADSLKFTHVSDDIKSSKIDKPYLINSVAKD